MAEKSADKFANYAIITVAESAANTLTFKKLETAISLSEKVAWVINRLEYLISGFTTDHFDASRDQLDFGLSVSSSWSSVAFSEITIIDYNSIQRLDHGTAASSQFIRQPAVKDFSALPGGGILVPPNPIYLYAKGSSLAAASTVTCRLHYTLRPLNVDEYWELVEARRVLSS